MLAMKDIHKTFHPGLLKKPFKALSGVNLEFPKGKCTGLLGHNGAGKTTAIRLVLGLLRPDKGLVEFEGHALARQDRQRIGYLPETVRMPGNFTCREVLQTHVDLYKFRSGLSRHELVQAKLEEVGMAPFATRKIRELSKGMAQRVAWAQATIHEPDLLILDEPFSGLDPVGRATMKQWILAEKKKERTLILCTHELPQVMSLCDHVQILRKGQIVYTTFNKAPDYHKRESQYFVEVSGADLRQIGSLKTEKKLPSWVSEQQDGFLTRLGFADYEPAAAWLAALNGAGFVIVRFGDDKEASEEQLLLHFKEEFTI